MKAIHKIYVALSPLPILYGLYVQLSSEVPFQSHNFSHEQIYLFGALVLILGFTGIVLILHALYKKQNVRWLVFGFVVSTLPFWKANVDKLIFRIWHI